MSTKKRPSAGEIFSSPQAEIEVGEEGKIFYVSKILLAFYSEYFRAAFEQGRFVEGTENKIILRDVDSSIFGVFLDWVYVQQIHDPKGSWSEFYNDDDLADYNCTNLVRLYVLADRFLVPGLSRAVLAMAYSLYERLGRPRYAAVNYAFKNLPENDPYLRLLVDAHSLLLDDDLDDEEELKERDSLPAKFFILVMEKLATHKVGKVNPLRREDYLQDDPPSEAADVS